LARYHLLLHWDWVKSVTKRLFGKPSNQARRYYFLDDSILLGFSIFSLTGLAISTWFNFPLNNYHVWVDIHVYTSILTLALLVLKITLHWRWIVFTARKIFFVEVETPSHALKPQVVNSSREMTRKGFLSLMSVVSVSSLLAVSNVFDLTDDLDSIEDIDPTESNSSQDQEIQPTASPPGPVSEVQPTTISIEESTLAVQPTTEIIANPTEAIETTCVVRCNKNCSYPGKCRKYVDANNNNLCDLAECA